MTRRIWKYFLLKIYYYYLLNKLFFYYNKYSMYLHHTNQMNTTKKLIKYKVLYKTLTVHNHYINNFFILTQINS